MELLRKHLSCSICLQLYKSPRTLQCLHSFCELCLKEHIEKSTSTLSDSMKVFQCPLCGNNVSPVNKTKLSTEWMKDFPLNSIMSSLLEGSFQNETHTSLSDSGSKICFPCSIDGKHSNGFAFCTKCTEYLCEECFNDHRKFKTTRSNCVLTGSHIPSDITHFQKLATSSICKAHSDKEVEFKCVNHDEFMCSLCAVTVHKHCDKIVPLNDLDDTALRNFKDIHDKFKKGKESLDQKVTATFVHAKEMTIELTKVESMKQRLLQRLTPIIEFIKSDLGESFTRNIEVQESKLIAYISECTSILNTLDGLQEHAKIVSTYGTPSQIELSRREIVSQQKEICKSIHLFCKTDTDKIPVCLSEDVNVLRASIEDVIGIMCGSTTENSSTDTHEVEVKHLAGAIASKGTQTQASHISRDVHSYKDNETQTMITCNSQWTRTTCKEIQTQTSASDLEKQTYAETLMSSEDDSSASVRNDKTLHYSSRPKRSVSETRLKSERQLTLPHGRAPALFLDRELIKVGQHDLSVTGKAMGISSHKASVLRKDGWMAFMDATNKVIKLVDPCFEVKSYAMMEVQPLDMCLTVHETVAVAIPRGICIFPIENEKLGKPSFFSMKYDPVSICLSGENLAILCYRKCNDRTIYFIQIRNLITKLSNKSTHLQTIKACQLICTALVGYVIWDKTSS